MCAFINSEENDNNFQISTEAYTGPGYVVNSSFLDGLKSPDESIIKTIKTSYELN